MPRAEAPACRQGVHQSGYLWMSLAAVWRWKYEDDCYFGRFLFVARPARGVELERSVFSVTRRERDGIKGELEMAEDGSEPKPPPVGLDINSTQFMNLRQACEMGEPRACTIFGAGLSQDRLPIFLQRRSDSPGSVLCGSPQPTRITCEPATALCIRPPL